MQDKFESIVEFSKLRECCVFCKTPMRVIITNYTDSNETQIPIINSTMSKNQFEFTLKHTTRDFDIKADVLINAEKNVLIFDNFTNGELPAIDEYLVRQTFEDYRPHIELYCPSRKCGLNYYISSRWFKLIKIPSVKGAWSIQPFKFMLEGIRIKNYIVHNDWEKNTTWIYSRVNENAEPISTPLVDFSTMDKDRVITRIQTIVTFS